MSLSGRWAIVAVGLPGTIEVVQQDESGGGWITGVVDDNINAVSGEKRVIAKSYWMSRDLTVGR